MFDTSSVRWVKKAITLYSQLELDWVAVAMIVELLKQKEKLTEENEYLHRRLTRF
jgi:chaperone modulatory protein CbpM